jgi:thiamine kinase-like enzyme
MQHLLEPGILEAVPQLAGRPHGHWRLERLGGITNRTYLVVGPDTSYVLRVAAPTTRYLDRAAEAHNAGVAGRLGIAPAVLHADDRLLLTEYLPDSRQLRLDDLHRPERLDQVADLLRRLQAGPEPFRGHRHPFGEIDRYLAMHPDPRSAELRRRADPIAAALAAAPLRPVPAHVDTTAANFLVCPDRSLRLVDWEFSAMTDPCWDIAAVLTQLPFAAERTRRFAARVLGRADAAILARVALFRAAMFLVAGSWCAMEAALRHDAELDRMAQAYLDRCAEALADPEIPRWIAELSSPA